MTFNSTLQLCVSVHVYVCVCRPPSCLTNQSPTCPSCPVSWRRRCLPPSLIVRSSVTMMRIRSTRYGCLTPELIRFVCWTSGHPRCVPPCTRNARTLKKQVRSPWNLCEFHKNKNGFVHVFERNWIAFKAQNIVFKWVNMPHLSGPFSFLG